MSLIGGGGSGAGGAGNPVGGSNPAGIGQTLNYIGNHAYAYSGVVTSAGSQGDATTTALKFETAGSYIEVTIAWGNTQTSNTADNMFKIKMDSQEVYGVRFREGGDSNHTNPKNLHLIIPPYTSFEALVGTSADAHNWTVTLVGRVYA
jgi:hypothetical protein